MNSGIGYSARFLDSYFSFHAVSVTWNNSTITGPVLIYHDKIGLLSCQSSADTEVAWHLPNGTTVGNLTQLGVFFQLIIHPGMKFLLHRDSNVSTANHNGLWSCRLSGDTGSAIPVGLYQRGREYSIATVVNSKLGTCAYIFTGRK